MVPDSIGFGDACPPEFGPRSETMNAMVELCRTGWGAGRDATHPGDRLHWDLQLRRRGWHLAEWPADRGGPDWTPAERCFWHWHCAWQGCPDLAPAARRAVGPVLCAWVSGAAQELVERIADGAVRIAVALGDAIDSAADLHGTREDLRVSGRVRAWMDQEPAAAPVAVVFSIQQSSGETSVVSVAADQTGVHIGGAGEMLTFEFERAAAQELGVVANLADVMAMAWSPLGDLARAAVTGAALREQLPDDADGRALRHRLDATAVDVLALRSLLARAFAGQLDPDLAWARLVERTEQVAFDIAAATRDVNAHGWIAQRDPILEHNAPASDGGPQAAGSAALVGMNAGASTLLNRAAGMRRQSAARALRLNSVTRPDSRINRE